MRHNLPSIKTLRTIAPDRARELRKVLEITLRAELESLLFDTDKYPVTRDWYRRCYNPMPLQITKLSIAGEIIETHGVESIPRGHNAKSPGTDYCNAGDTYATTLMWVEGKGYRVGCWGDIVERGHYD